MAPNILYRTEEHGTQMIFVSDKKTSIFQEYFPQISQRVLQNVATFRFRRITIKLNPVFNPVEARFNKIASGFIDMKDIRKGIPRLNINEGMIEKGIKGKFWETIRKERGIEAKALSSTDLQELKSLIKKYADEKLTFIIIHEVTHLWYQSREDIYQMHRTFLKRQENARNSMKKDGKLFGSDSQLSTIWATFRNIIETSFIHLMDEGIAYFNECLEKSIMTMEKSNLEARYVIAEENCKNIEQRYYKSLNEFKKVLDLRKNRYGKIQKFKKSNEISKEDAAFNKDFVNKAEMLKGGLIGNYTLSFHGAYYHIGAHIFQTILYANPDLSLKMVGEMPYPKIFETYDKSCRQLGIRPVYSLRDGSAILCRDKMVQELTNLRKMYS